MQRTVRVPQVFIFIKRGSKTTTTLMNYVKQNINEIRKNFTITWLYVSNPSVRRRLSKFNIKIVPVIRFKKQWYIGPKKTMQFLNSYINNRKEIKSQANVNIQDYMHEELFRGVKREGKKLVRPNDDDSSDPIDGSSNIQEKMSRFQSRRPKMAGTDDKSHIDGGQPNNNFKVVRKQFANDEDFISEYKSDDNMYKTTIGDNILNPDDYALEDYLNTSVNNVASNQRGFRFVTNSKSMYKRSR